MRTVYPKKVFLVASVQAINGAIRASSEIGHIDQPARDALAKIMFDAIKPHKDELLTPAILLDVQCKVADGIVRQAKKFMGLNNFATPLETFKQTAEEMKRKRPLCDLSDPSTYPVKDETLRLYGEGKLTCGKAVEIDPYVFMPNP